jgi:hypothetical protein
MICENWGPEPGILNRVTEKAGCAPSPPYYSRTCHMSKPKEHRFSAKVCWGLPASFGVHEIHSTPDTCDIYKT